MTGDEIRILGDGKARSIVPRRRMRLHVGVLLALVLASGLPVVAAEPPAPPMMVTKVFYLQGMELRDAMTLLRTKQDVRNLVMIASRSALVVSDEAANVDKAESFLREKKALVQVGVPHGPLQLELRPQGLTETRVFMADSQSIDAAVVVLRAIYHVAKLKKTEGNDSISVEAPKPVLDASESLLGSLGLLADSKAAAKP